MPAADELQCAKLSLNKTTSASLGPIDNRATATLMASALEKAGYDANNPSRILTPIMKVMRGGQLHCAKNLAINIK